MIIRSGFVDRDVVIRELGFEPTEIDRASATLARRAVFRSLLVASLLLAAAIVLSGCSATLRSTVPPSLLECEPQPVSPAGNPKATDRDAALYVVDLAAAGEDCRSKLASVRRIVTPPEKSK